MAPDLSLRDQLRELSANLELAKLKQTVMKSGLDDASIEDLDLEAWLSFLCRKLRFVSDENLGLMEKSRVPLSAALVIAALPPRYHRDLIGAVSEKLDAEGTPLMILKQYFVEAEGKLRQNMWNTLGESEFDHLAEYVCDGSEKKLMWSLKRLSRSKELTKVTSGQLDWVWGIFDRAIRGGRLPHEKSCPACLKIARPCGQWAEVYGLVKKWS